MSTVLSLAPETYIFWQFYIIRTVMSVLVRLLVHARGSIMTIKQLQRHIV